ncbi:hypothetical protein [Streptomyces sp. NPDC002611]
MPEDSDQAVAFTFRTGYGVVTVQGEVSDVGLFEYPTTAERVFRRHLDAYEAAVEHRQEDESRPPVQYRGIPVPAALAYTWDTGAAAQWRKGVD